jgi:hypothetical protein
MTMFEECFVSIKTIETLALTEQYRKLDALLTLYQQVPKIFAFVLSWNLVHHTSSSETYHADALVTPYTGGAF